MTEKHADLIFSRSSTCRKSHEGRRLLRKNGKSEVLKIGTDANYVFEKETDVVHTLINADWKWTLAVLIATFIVTWFLFALLWMAIAAANGDKDEPISEQCFVGIGNFTGYLLFSIETQTSVGYGTRSITQNCYEAIILVCFQILIGTGLGGSIVSIVYAKMISPSQQHADRCFSKNAIICQRDGELCLVFRIRDPLNKYGFGTNIEAFLVKMRDGECLLKRIDLEPTGMIIWPTDMVHRITKSSPFWDLSAVDLVSKRFEIIVVMEGTSLSTNQSSRTVTSYLSNEILWGYTFKSCVKYDTSKKTYRVSHKRFNATIEIPTPLCSSQRLHEVFSDLIRSESEIRGSSEGSERTSTSPESGIVLERSEEYESSEFSTTSSEDEQMGKGIGSFQFRRRSSAIVTSLLESLQKYVQNDARKNVTPLETSL